MFNPSQDPTLAPPPRGPRKPRRLPGIQASRYVDDAQVSQLLSKYGDLTGGGLVAPVIAQSSELMRSAVVAQGRGGARVGSRRDDVEYMPRREHELQMAQMDERIRQLSEELRRRDAAHEELAAQVRALMARNGVNSANDDVLGYSRPRPLAGQHPLAEHPVDAMRSLQPPIIPDFNGDLGQNAPEVDPSQSTGALPPIVPMLPLPPALNATGASLGSHFGGGPPLSDNGASDDGGGMHEGGQAGDDADVMFGMMEGLAVAPDVEPPERTIGEAGLLRLTAADGFCQVVYLELQYASPVVVATPVPANTSDVGPSPAPSPAPDGDTDGATLEVAVVRKSATSFTIVLLPRAGPRPTQVMVAYVVLEAGAHLLSSGATLIAGESSLSPVEPLTMQFESSFVRCPALLTTLAANAPRVRPRCLEVDSTRFGLGLEVLPFGADRLDAELAAEKGGAGGSAGTDPAATGHPAQLAVAPSPSPPPPISSEAVQEATEAAAAYSPGGESAAEEPATDIEAAAGTSDPPAAGPDDGTAAEGAAAEAAGEGGAEGGADAVGPPAQETDPAEAAAAAPTEGGEAAAASVPPSPPPSPPAGLGSEPNTPPPDDGAPGDEGEPLGVNDDVAVAWLACDCEGGDGVLSGVLDISPGAATDVSFGIDYHELPVFLCALMGPLGPVGTDAPPPPLRCERLHERGATLIFGDADGPAEPVEQAGWLALQQGKLWALEAYDQMGGAGGLGPDDDGGRIGIHPM